MSKHAQCSGKATLQREGALLIDLDVIQSVEEQVEVAGELCELAASVFLCQSNSDVGDGIDIHDFVDEHL